MKPEASQIHPSGLYLVPTPIGNLRDITLRALDVLQIADLIVCEDTRVTAKLLAHYGIRKPTLSYNDHNGAARRPKILAALEEGQRVAVVSDAGTPLISDPGYKLAREAIERGIYVTALPGASSVLPALSLSGLPTDRFFFAGFVVQKKEMAALAAVPSTLIFFEAARRLGAALTALAEALGDREAAVVREISKTFEEARRGTLRELAAHYEESGAPKGEVVIVVAPPGKEATSALDIEEALQALLETHSVKEASALLAERSGRKRQEIYTLALQLKNRK